MAYVLKSVYLIALVSSAFLVLWFKFAMRPDRRAPRDRDTVVQAEAEVQVGIFDARMHMHKHSFFIIFVCYFATICFLKYFQ